MIKRMFSLVKSSNTNTSNNLAKSNSKLEVKGYSIPNQDLLFISDKNPDDISIGLSISISISFSDGEIKFKNNEHDDPSTIFLKLPIKQPANPDSVEPPGYYPTYAGLKPEQRWIYLNWLKDVFEEINIGYVFIYYYGLERQLLTGKFDRAYDEILKLRRYHRNKSFLGYSESSLINASLLMKRPDKLQKLQQDGEISDFSNSLFLIAYYNEYNLSKENPQNPNDLLRIDWQRDISDGTYAVKYTDIKPGAAENGGYISAQYTKQTPYDHIWDIYDKGENNHTYIEWNGSTEAGRVKDYNKYFDNNWHCCDTNHVNCACP